jgi:hypothetical protein
VKEEGKLGTDSEQCDLAAIEEGDREILWKEGGDWRAVSILYKSLWKQSNPTAPCEHCSQSRGSGGSEEQACGPDCTSHLRRSNRDKPREST